MNNLDSVSYGFKQGYFYNNGDILNSIMWFDKIQGSGKPFFLHFHYTKSDNILLIDYLDAFGENLDVNIKFDQDETISLRVVGYHEGVLFHGVADIEQFFVEGRIFGEIHQNWYFYVGLAGEMDGVAVERFENIEEKVADQFHADVFNTQGHDGMMDIETGKPTPTSWQCSATFFYSGVYMVKIYLLGVLGFESETISYPADKCEFDEFDISIGLSLVPDTHWLIFPQLLTAENVVIPGDQEENGF